MLCVDFSLNKTDYLRECEGIIGRNFFGMYELQYVLIFFYKIDLSFNL